MAKIFDKTLVLMAFATFSLSDLSGKSYDFYLDHTPCETFLLQDNIPASNQGGPDCKAVPSLYFQELKIENVGNRPVRNCFPNVGGKPALTLEGLAEKISDQGTPAYSLYQLWKNGVVADGEGEAELSHPLDLLNFEGRCSEATFNTQFIALCNALNFNIRLANVKGKEVFDFSADEGFWSENWQYMDLSNHQFYLKLDNGLLASSDEVMDDPFLALRTKHGGQWHHYNIKDSWKQLACFDILNPASSEMIEQGDMKLASRAKGFDLYPKEKLLFSTAAVREDLPTHQCAIDHVVSLKARSVARHWSYKSPYPLNRIKNESSSPLYLISQKQSLLPGESLTFDQSLFELHLVFDEKEPSGNVILSGKCGWTLFPSLSKGENTIDLGVEKNKSRIKFHYEVDEELEWKEPSIPAVLNRNPLFDHCTPTFHLNVGEADKIWWQISSSETFDLVAPNLDQVQSANSSVSLSILDETFLTPGVTYYYRLKARQDGQWSEWSHPFSFSVIKPDAVSNAMIGEKGRNAYELNWKRFAEKSDGSTEYYVFASNAQDFLPSIYSDKQINEIIDDQVTEEEVNDNLIAITTNPRLTVTGNFAYFRIIPKKNGHFGLPSPLIRLYDSKLNNPRNVLQKADEGDGFVAKRSLFPSKWSKKRDFFSSSFSFSSSSSGPVKLRSLLRSMLPLRDKATVEYIFPNVSEEAMEEVQPYLLPDNHPAWPKLNRIFCKVRATQSPEHFRRAGFRRWQPGRWSRVCASSHAQLQEYFIKAYCDVELGILYDWRKWIHRIRGADTIRTCINEKDLGGQFKVPHKWIYPLPKNPSPPKSSNYVRKNFILVCENMRILDHDENEYKYRHELTTKQMKGVYTILQTCGLYDSTYVFNIPFCKDGKIAIIDTEYWYKWPVPYEKLTKYFPSDLQSYWKRLTYKGGKIPDGESQYNPPRMDRRDIPEKKERKKGKKNET